MRSSAWQSKVGVLRSEHVRDDIYGAHRRALIAYAERIAGDRAEAEDVVQDAWLQLRKVLDRETLRDPVPYLYRVVRNLAIDSRRRAGRQARHLSEGLTDTIAEIADEAPSSEAIISARAELLCVERALAALPQRQRIAIEMYRLGGFKLREIAERLNISVSLAHLEITKGLAECHRLCRPVDTEGSEQP